MVEFIIDSENRLYIFSFMVMSLYFIKTFIKLFLKDRRRRTRLIERAAIIKMLGYPPEHCNVFGKSKPARDYDDTPAPFSVRFHHNQNEKTTDI